MHFSTFTVALLATLATSVLAAPSLVGAPQPVGEVLKRADISAPTGVAAAAAPVSTITICCCLCIRDENPLEGIEERDLQPIPAHELAARDGLNARCCICACVTVSKSSSISESAAQID